MVKSGWKGAAWWSLSLAGVVFALAITWGPAVRVSVVRPGPAPELVLVEELRKWPQDAVLRELGDIALASGAARVDSEEAAIVAADQALKGLINIDGTWRAVAVPFQESGDLYDLEPWRLWLCGFAVPRTLGQGFSASGDERYLRAAVQYILDWSSFEAEQLVPRGYVLNDHATAARAVVVTEIWRLYRGSSLFRVEEATEFLSYVQVLMRRLSQERLFEFRSNHGLMQTLSLLHLVAAFPSLPGANSYDALALERLLSQLEYFVGPEGMILEHSPGYHQLLIRGLTAAWRHLALRGLAVPMKHAERYSRALEFSAAMARPDGTLPPIGDTDDSPYDPASVVAIDALTGIAGPLLAPRSLGPPRADMTLAPVTGWAVLWNGLAAWPDMSSMSQTVVHWADFPSRTHKHPDDMGISVWAAGRQWVRAIGYWPFDESRAAALDWRSSNAPHWLDEAPLSERRVALLASGSVGGNHFLDLERAGPDGHSLRRQLLVTAENEWTVIDRFRPADGSTGEIIWRFAPGTRLAGDGTQGFRISADGHESELMVSLFGVGTWTVLSDPDGTAEWNSGLRSSGKLLRTPAIRLVIDGAGTVLVSQFRLSKAATRLARQSAGVIRWSGDENWTLVGPFGVQSSPEWVRSGVRLASRGGPGAPVELDVSVSDHSELWKEMQGVLAAYQRAAERYGSPFNPMLQRRTKVTAAILVCALIQIALLAGLRGDRRRWRGRLASLALLGWCGLAAFLALRFLA